MSMITATELAEHRRDAEAQMVDTFALDEPTGTTLVDGLKRHVYTTRATGIPGKIQSPDPATVTVAGVDRQTIRARLDTPVASTAPAVGWVYRCTAVAATSDPAGLGRRWRVIPARTPGKTWMTARRVEVEEESL